MTTFFSIPAEIPPGFGMAVVRERAIGCCKCGKQTEDLLDEQLQPGDLVKAWCHCCETVTDQVVRW